MNEMESNNRGYDNRYYDEMEHGYRDYDNRDYRDYRDDYRTRNYDRRGGRLNNRDYRNYRNYRNQNYYEDLEMAMEDMREQYRNLEDISEMATNPQEKNILMKVAQTEKENYHHLKQMMEK